MNAFANHFSFQFRTGIRNRSLLLLNYLFPLGFYAMMGLIMTQINPLFRDTMVPAMVTFVILTATLLGLPDPLVTAREAGIFRSFKINGVPALSILAIPALTTVLHTVVASIVVIVTAPVFFDAPLPVNWAGFSLTFLLTAFACSGLAVLIGVVSPSSQATVLWSQLVFIPAMLLSGLAGLPYSMLPEVVGRLALLLPSTHAMNAFRALAMGLPADLAPLASLAVLLVSGVLAFGLAIYLFNWDRHNAAQRGHPALALLALLPYAVEMLLRM